MKRMQSRLMAAGLAGLLSAGAMAGSAELRWEDPDTFADIRAGQTMGQAKFEERVLKDITGYFQAGAERYLPEGQTLFVHIQDLDLAGEVEYFHNNFPHGLRVIRNLYFPRLKFSYEVRDADDRILQSGDENLRDLRARYLAWQRDDKPMFYEERMIREWFQEAFRDPAQS